MIVFYNEVDVLELKVCDRLGGKKKTALEERLLSKQLKGFASKRNLKLPGKSHKRKIRRTGDDLKFWQKRLQTCARKKVKSPSEA